MRQYVVRSIHIAIHKTLMALPAIVEKEIEIIHELAQEILQYENTLKDASDMCGELDRYFTVLSLMFCTHQYF